MKKINHKQREIIKFFQNQLNFWENTNDIDSPTHLADIREFMYTIDAKLDVEQIHAIQMLARHLYLEIQQAKEDKPWKVS